jgi:hypothetical protein
MREVKIALAFLTVAAHARAADECLKEYEHAQLARKAGKLVESRDALRVCASSTCPKVTRDDCGPWLVEVEQTLASIVVTGRCGEATQAATVMVDGHPIGDGAVDPGSHLIDVRTAYGTATQSVVIPAAQKSQAITIDLPADACPPPEKSKKRSLLPLAVATGGTGVVAFGFWAGFGIAGVSDRQNLVHTCYPHCTMDQVDGVKGLFTAADVAMVIGIVALATTGGILIYDWVRSPTTASASRPLTIAF